MFASMDASAHGGRNRDRAGNERRCHTFGVEQMDLLQDGTFKKMFRVDRLTFYDILERITPFMWQRDETKAHNSSGSSIPVKTRLAVSLRWLAGGSYLDICFAWGIGHSTFYHHDGILWPTLEAIDAAYHLIGLPFNDPEQLEKLSEGFKLHSRGILDGCIMAIEGFAVRTRQPFRKETPKPKDYRFRKDGFAIIIIAACDVDARFIMASCNHSGSTNDIIEVLTSALTSGISNTSMSSEHVIRFTSPSMSKKVMFIRWKKLNCPATWWLIRKN